MECCCAAISRLCCLRPGRVQLDAGAASRPHHERVPEESRHWFLFHFQWPRTATTKSESARGPVLHGIRGCPTQAALCGHGDSAGTSHAQHPRSALGFELRGLDWFAWWNVTVCGNLGVVGHGRYCGLTAGLPESSGRLGW